MAHPGPTNEAVKKGMEISLIFGDKIYGDTGKPGHSQFPGFGLASLCTHILYPYFEAKNKAHFHSLFFGLPKLPYLLILPWVA